MDPEVVDVTDSVKLLLGEVLAVILSLELVALAVALPCIPVLVEPVVPRLVELAVLMMVDLLVVVRLAVEVPDANVELELRVTLLVADTLEIVVEALLVP